MLHKKIKIVLFILLFATGFQAYAQYNETIRSARPGQSFGPFTTGKSIFQVQTGFNINQIRYSDENLNEHGFNYLMSLRYGITETIEIRYAFRINRNKISVEDEELIANGLSAMVLGMRFNILNNAGTYKPSIGFQANVNLNVLSPEFNPDNPEPALLLLHNQKLTHWLKLTTNWGIIWNGNNADAIGLYTINFSFPISNRIGGFIENYGDISNRNLSTFFDTGIDYLINNDLLLDLSVGYGKNRGVVVSYIDFGVSWRIGL